MLHHTVIEQWGSDIVFGVLPVGYRIGAEDAVTHFAVSRTVIREAVRVLESMGLLTVRQRIGITVLPPERWDPFNPHISRWRLNSPGAARHLLDLAELRTVNEPLAARRAASSATTEQIEVLNAAVVGMATSGRAGDRSGYISHDADFHRALLVASDNPLLVGLGGLIGDALVSPAADSSNALCEPELIRLHAEVAAAIQSGNSSGAESAARTILDAHPPLVEPVHPLTGTEDQVLLATG